MEGLNMWITDNTAVLVLWAVVLGLVVWGAALVIGAVLCLFDWARRG